MIDRPGGIFVRAADQISAEDRILLQSVARAIFTDGQGTLAEQVRRRAPREPAMPPLMLVADAAGASGTGRLPAPRAVARQRHWRLLARRPRVRDHHHRRGGHAGAVGQRAGESALRLRRFRERAVVHVERERARVSTDAVAQRSGQRRERRGVLRARRGNRPFLVTLAAAASRRGPLHVPPRLRLQRVRARRGRHPDRAVRLRCDSTRRSSSACFACATSRTAPRRLSATGYVEWVLGDLQAEDDDAHRHRDRSGQRRRARAQRLPSGIRRQRRVLRRRRRHPDDQRRSNRVHRTQRHAARAGRALARAAVGQGRRRDGSLHRDPDSVRARRGTVAGDHLPPRRRDAAPKTRAGWSCAIASPEPRAPRSTR